MSFDDRRYPYSRVTNGILVADIQHDEPDDESNVITIPTISLERMTGNKSASEKASVNVSEGIQNEVDEKDGTPTGRANQ